MDLAFPSGNQVDDPPKLNMIRIPKSPQKKPFKKTRIPFFPKFRTSEVQKSNFRITSE